MDNITLESVVKNLNNLRVTAGLGLIMLGTGAFITTVLVGRQEAIIARLRQDVDNLTKASNYMHGSIDILIARTDQK